MATLLGGSRWNNDEETFMTYENEQLSKKVNEEVAQLLKKYNTKLLDNNQEDEADNEACEACHPEGVPSAGGLMGWICPKCGAAMSPFVDYCVKCSGNWEITYGTGTAPQTGFCQMEANFNEKER